MRSIVFIAILFFVSCGQDARAIKVERVWVEITEESIKDGTTYSYGWLSRNEYDNLVLSQKIPEVIRIKDLHWYSDDGLALGEGDTYTGEVVIRTDKIVRVSVTKEQDIIELRKEAKLVEEKMKDKKEGVIP